MKNFFAISIALGMLCFHSLSAQENNIKPSKDSIQLEFPENNALIVFKTDNMTKYQNDLVDLPYQLKEILEFVERGVAPLDKPRIVHVKIKSESQPKYILKDSTHPANGFKRIKTIKDKKEILITENKLPGTKINVQDGKLTQLLKPGWEIWIEDKHSAIYIFADTWANLKLLESKDLQPALNKIKSYYTRHSSTKHDKLYTRMIIKDNNVVYDDHKLYSRTFGFTINTNYGIGIFGDKLYPDLGLSIATKLSDDYLFEIKYNAMFIPSRNNDGALKIHPNSFLSLQYGFIGAGLLIGQKGDYFTGNTAKIFFTKQIGKVRISPELFLTDNLKKPIIGIKAVF